MIFVLLYTLITIAIHSVLLPERWHTVIRGYKNAQYSPESKCVQGNTSRSTALNGHYSFLKETVHFFSYKSDHEADIGKWLGGPSLLETPRRKQKCPQSIVQHYPIIITITLVRVIHNGS